MLGGDTAVATCKKDSSPAQAGALLATLGLRNPCCCALLATQGAEASCSANAGEDLLR
jgi:hypothetical protein